MAWHKEHTVTCSVCGNTFQTFGNRAKYCKACASKRQKEQKRSFQKKQQEKEKVVDPLHCCDSPEQIKTCLACTFTFCVGECPLNKSLGRRIQTRPCRSEENVRKALELRAQGLTYEQVGARLGISETTALRWIREQAREVEQHA